MPDLSDLAYLAITEKHEWGNVPLQTAAIILPQEIISAASKQN